MNNGELNDMLKNDVISFICNQFDSFNKEENYYLKETILKSNIFMLHGFNIDSDRPNASIKACILYNTSTQGAYIHYFCVDSSLRKYGIGTFLLLLVQSQLHFSNIGLTSLYLMANKDSNTYIYYTNTGFVKIDGALPSELIEYDITIYADLHKLTSLSKISDMLWSSFPDNLIFSTDNDNNSFTVITLKEFTSKQKNDFFKFPFTCDGTELDQILLTCKFRWLGLDITKDNKYWLNTIQQNDCYKTIDTFRNINSYIWSYKLIDLGYEFFK